MSKNENTPFPTPSERAEIEHELLLDQAAEGVEAMPFVDVRQPETPAKASFAASARPNKNWVSIFVDSAKELRTTKCLVITGMLTALNLVLGLLSIPVGNLMKFSFSFVATAVVGALYGPIPAAFCGGIADVLKAFLKPTGPYFPGFTVSAILVGVLYGLFLYKGRMTPVRIILSELTTRSLIGVLLQSYWLMILYGDASIVGILPSRLIQNGILLPIGIAVLLLISVAMKQIEKFVRT